MTVDWFYVGLGLAILVLAGDALVKGAVNLSLRLGVPPLIVGLTIVGFGTSAPELLVAVSAVIDDAPDIALGNVVGSNTANVLLILGIPALISGLDTDGCDTRASYLAMIAASAFFILLCFFGPIGPVHALMLLMALGGILWWQLRDARAHRAARAAQPGETGDIEGADASLSGWKVGLYLGLGLIGLPLGADLLVDGAVSIARDYGVSETVIGLTLVAVGTSLPELATTVMAAIRRQADVALGNVIGSNMFNLLAIPGIAGLIGPIPVDPQFVQFDLWVMLAASLLLAPFVFLGWRLDRRAGVALTGAYLGYLAAVLA